MINIIWLLPVFCIGFQIGALMGQREAYLHAKKIIEERYVRRD